MPLFCHAISRYVPPSNWVWSKPSDVMPTVCVFLAMRWKNGKQRIVSLNWFSVVRSIVWDAIFCANKPYNIGAIIFAANTNFNNGHINFLFQKDIVGHYCEEFEISWHISCMLLKFNKTSMWYSYENQGILHLASNWTYFGAIQSAVHIPEILCELNSRYWRTVQLYTLGNIQQMRWTKESGFDIQILEYRLDKSTSWTLFWINIHFPKTKNLTSVFNLFAWKSKDFFHLAWIIKWECSRLVSSYWSGIMHSTLVKTGPKPNMSYLSLCTSHMYHW